MNIYYDSFLNNSDDGISHLRSLRFWAISIVLYSAMNTTRLEMDLFPSSGDMSHRHSPET